MGIRWLLLGLSAIPAVGCEQSEYSHAKSAGSSSAAAIEPERPETTVNTDAEARRADASPLAEEKSETTPADPAKPYVDDGSKDPGRASLPHKDTTFDDIKFDIAKDSKFEPAMLTPQIEELIGRRIRIRGFIFPSFQQKLRNFVLTRDNQECCFGPGAAIYDCIQVTMAPGTTAEYTTRIVTVEGRLTLRELLDFDDPGITRAIYHLDATSVR
jgi:hypothetical protein